ncbi:MAG: bifunctional response regulator/alkaline phosphatase family protein [Ignavibacteriaceae bacterium]
MKAKKLLWVDDEIEMLRSHIIFLSEKGYDVDTATNGEDAISNVKQNSYDLIFLDENMAGMGGLETLGQIKDFDQNIPVVMITKSEEETLMNEAIGGKISDYLTKPVNPSQVLLVCKKFLEGKKISGEYATKDYLQDFNQISQALVNNLDFEEWIDIYLKMVNWDIEIDQHSGIGLRQTLNDQRKEANKEFSKFVEKNYKNWINDTDDPYTPLLTTEIVSKYVFPHVEEGNSSVFFFVLDCMRADQWLVMEKLLSDYFKISKDYYYSILPTATPYARNSLFGGLFAACRRC